MLTIDGSEGEGGGQILRSALALSLVTGTPFRAVHIRAGRRKPGLLRQHLTALRAAAEIGGAEVSGDEAGATEITFRPRRVTAGDHHFAIGSAGSASLVLQTVLPALVIADAPSRVVVEGGTHNPAAPPFEFLSRCFAPVLARMGPVLALELARPGFYPAGGGRIVAEVTPVAKLAPIAIVERGPITGMKATATVSSLPANIAHRELAVCKRRLGLERDRLHAVVHERDYGPGNVLVVEVESDGMCEVATGFGEKGVTAERVANVLADGVERYLAADVPVGEHLADQLVLPFSLAGAGEMRTLAPSLHTTTQLDLVRRFLPVTWTRTDEGPDRVRLAIV